MRLRLYGFDARMILTVTIGANPTPPPPPFHNANNCTFPGAEIGARDR
jgi:hypothetical protein